MTKCGKFCPGAGCTEIKIASLLEKEANFIKGLDRYAYVKFANAFETIPRILSDNAGLEANEIITRLYAKNNGDE
jgi:T-complex protein 1 subunit theta